MQTEKENEKKETEIKEVPLTRKCPQCQNAKPVLNFFKDRADRVVCDGCYMENTDGNEQPINSVWK